MTVLESAEHGFLGGYLVLNHHGRPLEFHCTAPVRPNRAQEILYGTTLKPYLFGDQIGQTLWSQSKKVPHIIYTDLVEVLQVRQFIPHPVVLIVDQNKSTMNHSRMPAHSRVDTAHTNNRAPHVDHLQSFCSGEYALAIPEAYSEDKTIVLEQCESLGESFDLQEPLDRIRCAIQEAQLQ